MNSYDTMLLHRFFTTFRCHCHSHAMIALRGADERWGGGKIFPLPRHTAVLSIAHPTVYSLMHTDAGVR